MRGKITECWLAKTEGIFLNHEGTFGNQQGMLTWCWLATKRYCRWNYFYNNGFPFRGSWRNLNFVSRMQFPQKCCPLCDKKVIASALWQLRFNFTCIFKVLLQNLPSGPCDYIGSVENAECGVRSVENAECGKCGVWKMRSVKMRRKFQFSVSLCHSNKDKQCVNDKKKKKKKPRCIIAF